jgi:hypothetical protein
MGEVNGDLDGVLRAELGTDEYFGVAVFGLSTRERTRECFAGVGGKAETDPIVDQRDTLTGQNVVLN